MGTAPGESSAPSIENESLTEIAETIAGTDIDRTTAEILTLQIVGGVENQSLPGDCTTGQIHTALIAPACVNTSSVVSRVVDILPDTARVNGGQATRAGIIGAIDGDEILHGPVLDEETSLTAIEAATELSEDKQTAFREPLDASSFSFYTKHVQETVPAHGNILFTAQPESGHLDDYIPFSDQINLDPVILHGVDIPLVVSSEDIPGGSSLTVPLTIEAAREHVEAAQQFTPEWEPDAEQALVDFTETVREKYTEWDEDREYKPSPGRMQATARKFAEAHARLRSSMTVTAVDLRKVIDLLTTPLQKLGLGWDEDLTESPEFTTPIIEQPDSTEDDDDVPKLKTIVEDLETEFDNGAPVERVIEKAVEEGYDADEVEDELDTLRMKGEVYNPTGDYIRST